MDSDDQMQEAALEVTKQAVAINRLLNSEDGKYLIEWLTDNYIDRSSVHQLQHVMNALVGQKELAQEICGMKEMEVITGENNE